MSKIKEMEIVEDGHLWTCPYCKLIFMRTKCILIRDGKVEHITYNHELAKGQYNIPIGVTQNNHDFHKCRLSMRAKSYGYEVKDNLGICWNCDSSEVSHGYGERPEMYCKKLSEKGRTRGYRFTRWVNGYYEIVPTGTCRHWKKTNAIRTEF